MNDESGVRMWTLVGEQLLGGRSEPLWSQALHRPRKERHDAPRGRGSVAGAQTPPSVYRRPPLQCGQPSLGFTDKFTQTDLGARVRRKSEDGPHCLMAEAKSLRLQDGWAQAILTHDRDDRGARLALVTAILNRQPRS
jgi:hypothetical protein